MAPRARTSEDRRRAVIAVALASVAIVGWLAAPPPADAQIIPDPGDIKVPDPPDLDLPDVDPPDIDLPDVEPPDIEVPDPPDPPDPDDPDDDSDDPGGKPDSGDGSGPDGDRKGAGGTAGRGDRGSGGGNGVASTPYAHLAAARGDGNLVIVPSASEVDAASRPEDDGKGLWELLAPLGFPMLLMVAIGGFLTLQDHLERRAPRGLLVPSDSTDQVGVS